jgi:Polyketide cyclase / dehydrase and lipid transport
MAVACEISIGFPGFGPACRNGQGVGDRVVIACRRLDNPSPAALRRQAMAKAYYSTVFEQSAEDIWEIIRDFNNYPVWVGGAGESRIEDGKSGDAVGAIRNVLYQRRRIRQRLLAQSDVERSQTYEFCEAPTLPLTAFQATLRVTPVIDGNCAFVEWKAVSTAILLAAAN